MKFTPTSNRRSAVDGPRNARHCGLTRATASTDAPGRWPAFGRAESGFTLAEVLAALVFMAIVIPVALQGLQIASRAGLVSERKAIAARLAESKLNELIVTRQWSSSASHGTIQEGLQSYDWRLENQPWAEDGTMRLVTVWVIVPVRGQDYEVPVSTLVDATQ